MYPLTSGYRIAYWVILALMLVAFVAELSEGKILFPGLVGIGTVVSLVSDRRMRGGVASPLVADGPAAG